MQREVVCQPSLPAALRRAIMLWRASQNDAYLSVRKQLCCSKCSDEEYYYYLFQDPLHGNKGAALLGAWKKLFLK